MSSKNKNKKILTALVLALGGFFIWNHAALAAPEDIVISEIMYDADGADTDREWVEIHNSGAGDVTIVEGSGEGSWRFNDGSNHTLTLTQGSLTISAGGFAIIASDAATFIAETGFAGTVLDTVMSLNNTSDTLSLSADKGQTFFGAVTYQNTWGANGDGRTLEKITLAGGNDESNWQASADVGGTPGAVSSGGGAPPEPESEEESAPSAPAQSGSSGGTPSVSPTTPQPTGDPNKIKITELYPNPDTDQSQEFIELWNGGETSISLEGWRLADAAKVITLKGITLVPGEYRALYRSTTSIALNNSNEVIKLYGANGDLIDELSYEKTVKGYGYALNLADSSFSWTSTRTPGSANLFTTPNAPPVPAISFSHNPVAPNEPVIISARSSADADGDSLSFLWSIGERFEASGASFSYRFPSLGAHLVNLTVSDGRHAVATSSAIKVMSAVDVVSLRIAAAQKASGIKGATGTISGEPATSSAAAPAIYITEIFPNPAGPDDGEWIELYNPNDADVSLEGWSIDDAESGSKSYAISDITIGAGEYILLERAKTKIALNNTNDEARLFDASGTLVDSIAYEKVPEGKSYAKSADGLWVWTEEITPGEENAIDAPLVFAPEPGAAFPAGFAFDDSYPVDIDLANIRELELGTEVRVQGTVAVPPGVLAKTYFYITGSPGIQVYYSRSDWPALAVGDVIGVFGTLAESGGERRLKIANKADVVPLYAGEPPKAEVIETGAVGEGTEGWLVAITGELVEKKGNSWYIDDGSGEARTVFQASANIKKPAAKAGEWVSVTGMVSQTASGYRVLPRFQDDVRVVAAEELAESGVVLGAQTAPDELQRFRIPTNNKPQELLQYLLITSAALVALLAGLLIKLRIETRKRLKELEERIKK